MGLVTVTATATATATATVLGLVRDSELESATGTPMAMRLL